MFNINKTRLFVAYCFYCNKSTIIHPGVDILAKDLLGREKKKLRVKVLLILSCQISESSNVMLVFS